MSLPPPLVALTPGSLRPGQERALLAAVEAACAAGLRGVLLREPGLADGALTTLAAALRRLLSRNDAAPGWLAVHDRPHVALVVGADAVHLGYRSLSPAAVRSGFGTALAIGLSTHAHDDPADWAAADYVFHGPVRATPSKEGLLEPIGMRGLERACRASRVPVLAIGGLEPQDAPQALARGAHGLAVLRGVLGAADPALATRRYLDALGNAPGNASGNTRGPGSPAADGGSS